MVRWINRVSDRLGRLVGQHVGKGEESVLRLRRRVATVVGAVLLSIAALVFARLGDLTQRLFASLTNLMPFAVLIVTPLIFALVVHATLRWVPGARGSGIPQVIAAARDPQREGNAALTSIRTGVVKVFMTLLMLLVGGSVGREGPTVQLSASIMVTVHRVLRVPINAGVLIAGGAAGVAAAFNTPLAGIAFAIEELASAYEQRVAVLVMAAVMVSGLVSLGIAGDYIYFGQMGESLGVHAILIVTPVAGIVGGLAGGLFSRILLAFADPAHE
jgi:H+/Cl- antiporter ClcA